MAAASCLLTEDQLMCSICLDVFTDPVTTPCGHNFCKNCLTQHWNTDRLCQCPICKKTFYSKPELQVNTLISDMAHEFRQKARDNAGPEKQAAKPGGPPCDSCSGTKKKALVFCLVWMYVYAHLVHKQHGAPLNGGKMAKLVMTEDKIQQMIQKIQLKIEQIRHSVKLSEKDAGREIEDGVQVFTALKESVETVQDKLIKTITEKQRASKEQAEGFIKELEQEVSELRKRRTEMELLSATKLEETLTAEMKREMSKLLAKAELKRVQRYAVDVTLDPDTAHPSLVMSGDLKQVSHGNVRKQVADNPGRFDYCVISLGKQGFSSGRFYFEVQVKGKTEWDLGVARESITRKGDVILQPQSGYWTIWLRKENEYKALTNSAVPLHLKTKPEKVGVFVDYEEGLVSFYDVDTAALMYSFTGCSFTEKLYPYLSPSLNHDGKNSAPLIITPVNHTE
ncbi:E3 ubiquitin-protein ligase TRIM21-like [Toxotes jaculatrix]|uniref:E3 ubiquitin-protein ligase TRIM21-like n=1 Tax=Toxotes jaculatrix TaxID=941984 RepID=UPI001B3ABBF2|nr:E3 ubiquitin-protein ligase TRIM21-like [Toxotes jaculatrix]